jgi:peroxiredoxin family protein
MPKTSIIGASEKLDKSYPAFILATTAAVSRWKAKLFFTFWCLLALKRGYEPTQISVGCREYSGILTEALSSGAILNWRTIITQAKTTGKLKVYACSTIYDPFGLNEKTLENLDSIVGAAYFLRKAKDPDITLFIS